MSEQITFTIDGKQCTAEKGDTIVAAAKKNGVYIPTLCDFEGLKPAATCRVCTVKVNGAPTTACSATVSQGVEIESNTEEITNIRKAVVEMMFVEGNHFCPACEKSGSCDLQALCYKYQMMVPRYDFTFPRKELDATSPKLLIEKNRCILCKRCVRSSITTNGKSLFAVAKRGNKTVIQMDKTLAADLSEEQAKEAMELCPVGAILKKETGFVTPIGQRKYDAAPIGSDIESNA